MVRMNKTVNIPSIQKIMVNFQVENERAEMTQEVMGDMLDDAMAEDGDSDEEEKIVGAVLDEIGISLGTRFPTRRTRWRRGRNRRRSPSPMRSVVVAVVRPHRPSGRRHDGVRPRGAAEQPAEVGLFLISCRRCWAPLGSGVLAEQMGRERHRRADHAHYIITSEPPRAPAPRLAPRRRRTPP